MSINAIRADLPGSGILSDLLRTLAKLDTGSDIRKIELKVVDLLIRLADGSHSRSEILEILTQLLGRSVDRDVLIDLISALLENRSDRDLVLMLAALLIAAQQVNAVGQRDGSLTPEFRDLLSKVA